MPTVPTYQDTQQHVALRPEYTEGFTVKADAEAFGSAIGKGMQGLATGMGTLGEAVVQVEQLDNANAAKDADTKFGDWMRGATYGKDGYLTLTGRAAVEGRAGFEKLAEQKRAEFGKGLTPGARRDYDRSTDTRMNTLLDSTIRHQADQRKAWFAETSSNNIKSASEDAVAVYGDPAKVDAAIQKGVTEIAHQGHMRGSSKEKLARESAQFVSDTTKKVVLRMASESPLKAEQYLHDAGGKLLPADRTELQAMLKGPVIDEKANRNAADIIAGLPPSYAGDAGTAPSPAARQAGQSGTTKGSDQPAGNSASKTAGTGPAASHTGSPQPTAAPAPSGPEDFRAVASTMAFPGKAKDDLALAGFVKNAAGPSVDPSLKPWLAALAKGVLGALGSAGTIVETAALAPKTFRHFALPTETPRAGDLVVLGPLRNGATAGNDDNNSAKKGHIGFFRGYDADGNILVFGPNPNQAGQTTLSAHPPNQVISFRTSGTVDQKTMNLPNYSPSGLTAIEDSLNKIADPGIRAATATKLEAYFVAQKKAIDASRVRTQEWANNQVIADPNFNPMKMPIDVQQAIGPAGMTTLIDYREKVRAYGQPTTDPHTLYDLQMQFANHPAAFAQIDAYQYRAKLSDKDWEKVTGWQQMAATDQRKARLESLDLATAFELARPQLEGLGLLNNNPGTFSSNDTPRRAAQFQTMLIDQMDEFKAIHDGQNPTQSDVQKMINRLLLPIVIGTPSHGRGLPASETSGYLFEANGRADNANFDIIAKYEDIPRDLRMTIEANLMKRNGKKPTQDEIAKEYETFMLNR
jgi:hypothetical protein